MVASLHWDTSGILADLGDVQRQVEQTSSGQTSSGQPAWRLDFERARLLVCLPGRLDVRSGVSLLDQLVDAGHSRAEALRYLILAHLRLGEYAKAQRRAEALLNLQTQDATDRLLHSLVLDHTIKDGISGALLAAGLIAALVLSLGVGLRSVNSRPS
mmetsp:Transcript_20656/g.45297  ORF Transcript_20656/g.45297 Transcript_20656/m.45297 type:complete len:157 (+) Transcript_20656:64-534(+)